MHRDVTEENAAGCEKPAPAGPTQESWVVALAEEDLPENSMVGLTIGRHEVAVYHLAGGEFCATSNICTHGHALLSDGWLTEDGLVECPLHAGCFDVRTGAGQGAPIDEDLQTIPIRREAGQILLAIRE